MDLINCPRFHFMQPPPIKGIYICLDEHENVLYVGQSKNIKKRFGSHSRLNEIRRNGFRSLAVIQVNERSLDEVEAETIARLQPKLNLMPVRGYGRK